MEGQVKIPFNMENIKKCICPECPVQTKSKCVKKKVAVGGKMMTEIPADENMKMPTPADAPSVYCATGLATCGEIDTAQMCICSNCPLWGEYKLSDSKPASYYCRDGKAE